MQIEDEDFQGAAQGINAVDRLTEIAIVRLREKERTKRLLIVVVLFLFLFAATALIFAPPGRESVANIIGVALIVLALGAIGASKFILMVGGVSVDTKGEEGGRQPGNASPPPRFDDGMTMAKPQMSEDGMVGAGPPMSEDEIAGGGPPRESV